MVARISWILMVVLVVVEVVALVVGAAAAVSVVLVYTSSANNLCVRVHVREWAPILWRVRSRKVEHAS